MLHCIYFRSNKQPRNKRQLVHRENKYVYSIPDSGWVLCVYIIDDVGLKGLNTQYNKCFLKHTYEPRKKGQVISTR